MLISVAKRFVFVANSKTASTSVESSLVTEAEIQRGGSPQRKHIFLRAALREYDFLFGRPKYAPETFFKFGIMRDPVDWIQSWYRYRKGNKVARQIDSDMPFEEFWKQQIAQTEKSGKTYLQRSYFTRMNGTLLADYIIPYDDLVSHYATIAQGLGAEETLPHRNTSRIKTLDTPLSDALIDEIRDYYAEDYTLYNQLAEINTQGLIHLQATRPAPTAKTGKAGQGGKGGKAGKAGNAGRAQTASAPEG